MTRAEPVPARLSEHPAAACESIAHLLGDNSTSAFSLLLFNDLVRRARLLPPGAATRVVLKGVMGFLPQSIREEIVDANIVKKEERMATCDVKIICVTQNELAGVKAVFGIPHAAREDHRDEGIRSWKAMVTTVD